MTTFWPLTYEWKCWGDVLEDFLLEDMPLSAFIPPSNPHRALVASVPAAIWAHEVILRMQTMY